MPRKDGTGPAGMGPMTGRGFGFCKTNLRPRYSGNIFTKNSNTKRGCRYKNILCIISLLPGLLGVILYVIKNEKNLKEV